MAFRVFQVPDQGAYFMVLILCALISTGAIVLRFLATHRSRRKLGAEDWFSLAAVLLFLARIGLMIDCISIINGRSVGPNLDRQTYENVFKMIFAQSLTTMLDQTFSKLSVCALYLRIFSINRAYRRWVYVLAAAQCLTCVAFTCIQFLLCRPLQDFWTWPGGRNNCLPWTTLLLATEPPNSLIDFGLVAIAMVMLRPMQLTARAKWKPRFLFGLGSLVGLFGFIKIGIAYNPNPLHLTASLGIWGAIHSLLSIVCCCAPVYGALKAPGLWDRAASKIHLYVGSSKRREEKAGSQQEPWQSVPLDRYFEGEGWSGTRVLYNGSTRCLVTSDVQRGPPYKNENYPVGSIQVDRHVDVDYPRAYQALGQGMDSTSTEISQLSRPNASYQPRPAQSASPDV